MLVIAGATLFVLGMFAEQIDLGSRNGVFGVWQAGAVLAGGYAVIAGVALVVSPRMVRFAGRHPAAAWLGPRLFVIFVAATLLVASLLSEPRCPVHFDEQGRSYTADGYLDGDTLRCSYATSSAL